MSQEQALDCIHEVPSNAYLSPAQLYATDSGQLYHAGKMCIVLVGLPARGKTHHAVALTRYLRWLGVKTHAFHLGDYRRMLMPANFKVPDDYFMANASPETVAFRRSVVDRCLSDMYTFLNKDRGQVAIFDAVNPTAAIRRQLAADLDKNGIKPLFVECLVTDQSIVRLNVLDVKLSSPDYQDVDPDEAVRHYLRRIEMHIPQYETMFEPELSWVKLINVTEKFILNKTQLSYLHSRLVLFLINSRIKIGSIYFARAGPTTDSDESYKSDQSLSKDGLRYAQKLKDTLFRHLDDRRKTLQLLHTSSGPASFKQPSISDLAELASAKLAAGKHTSGIETVMSTPSSPRLGHHQHQHQHQLGLDTTPPVQSGSSTPLSPADARAVSTLRATELNMPETTNLTVWSSTRRKTVETASVFDGHVKTLQNRSLLNQLNPGDVDGLTEDEIKLKYPTEHVNHHKDPYHHRYPRSESYHDLAVRMEPLILEMERIPGDLLIIAHESVLRVLYGYLMACSISDIPTQQFPRNEILEIIPNAYVNQTNRIVIEHVDP